MSNRPNSFFLADKRPVAIALDRADFVIPVALAAVPSVYMPLSAVQFLGFPTVHHGGGHVKGLACWAVALVVRCLGVEQVGQAAGAVQDALNTNRVSADRVED